MSQNNRVATALLINTLYNRLAPFHKLELERVNSLDVEVLVRIGKYSLIAQLSNRDKLPVWMRRPLGNVADEQQRIDFVNHLNGILAGKVRNDAGELVSA